VVSAPWHSSSLFTLSAQLVEQPFSGLADWPQKFCHLASTFFDFQLTLVYSYGHAAKEVFMLWK
jgi:hypothetical protein